VHVLVATDGSLDIEKVTSFATRLAGDDGKVTVLTVVEIPRRLLSDLRRVMGELPEVGVIADDEYVETPAVAQQAPSGWPGDDAMIERYLVDKRIQCADPIATAISATGIAAEAIVAEGEKPANLIAERVVDLDADVLVIGSHGQGLFQGVLGSTGTKLVRRCPKPVLLLRSD
jgi:nucleotide-binding universal stress UspA family protein